MSANTFRLPLLASDPALSRSVKEPLVYEYPRRGLKKLGGKVLNCLGGRCAGGDPGQRRPAAFPLASHPTASSASRPASAIKKSPSVSPAVSPRPSRKATPLTTPHNSPEHRHSPSHHPSATPHHSPGSSSGGSFEFPRLSEASASGSHH